MCAMPPDPPGKRTAELDRTEIDHRQPLADLRQAAGMLVAKRSMRQSPSASPLIASATYRPSCFAAGAMPGTGWPFQAGNRHGVGRSRRFRDVP